MPQRRLVFCFLEAMDPAAAFPLELSLTSSWYDFRCIARSLSKSAFSVMSAARRWTCDTFAALLMSFATMVVPCYGTQLPCTDFRWITDGLLRCCFVSCVSGHLAGGCMGSRRAAPWFCWFLGYRCTYLTSLSPVSHGKRASPKFMVFVQIFVLLRLRR